MSATATRPAAVAGLFYPADETTLTVTIADLMRQAAPATAAMPKALIVPHAGYVYSGPIAASAYSQLVPVHDKIRRVVLLGPAHRVPVRGLALPGCSRFATPLGDVEIDQASAARLSALPQVSIMPAAHDGEHSLEVHLPFLQMVLDDFCIVPLVVGDATPQQVAEVLELAWGGNETLILISSDLSHYLPYARARAIDSDTCQRIVTLDDRISHQQACGATPIRGLLAAARRHHLQAHLLDLRNSGDTAGDRDGVVGYAAFAFTPQTTAPRDTDRETDCDTDRDAKLGATLLAIARHAITTHLDVPDGNAPASDLPQLDQPGATFVTLTMAGGLRGCIGSLEPTRPLAADVAANAVAAACHDPRFPPLSRQEWPDVRIEVSLLTPAEPMSCRDEADALAQLRPGIDGVILTCQGHRATFLPQVWAQLSDPAAFLAQLKRKAGLPPDYWSPAMRLSRYGVRHWSEPD